MCNNSTSRINVKNYERDIVGRFGNYQRTAGRCEAVVQIQPQFPSGVVDRKLSQEASKSNRVRPLQRRSIKLTFGPERADGGRVLGEVAAATLQRNKVVTRKLSSIGHGSRASRPYDLLEKGWGVFYYLNFETIKLTPSTSKIYVWGSS